MDESKVQSVDGGNPAGPVAPADHCQRPRKLVLCFDGTGNKFRGDDSDSNILKIFRMLDRTADDQYHYYQPGIGTYVVSKNLSHTSMRGRIKSWYLKAKDSAVGSSFDQHVVGGYRFLMRYYCPGDDIYIFGFSRGAYIARFLAEMLDYVGLLSHGNEEMVAFAWKAFSQWQCRQSTSDNPKAAAKKREMYAFLKGFRETFSRPVKRIRFLGLFDTVNSVPRFEAAWMQRSKFPYTARSSAKVIRHAVSIDERRAKFRQDLIYQEHRKGKKSRGNSHSAGAREKVRGMHEKYRSRKHTNDAVSTGIALGERGRVATTLHVPTASGAQAGDIEECDHPQRFRYRSRSRATSEFSTANHSHIQSDAMSVLSDISHALVGGYYDSDEDEDEQDVDEVWFAGGHADIGGGWDFEPDCKSASHVPLAWMVHAAMKAGLKFDHEKVAAMGCIGSGCDHDTAMPIPNITIEGQSPPVSPLSDKNVAGKGPVEVFHDLMHGAHTAKIHDSLEFGGGLSWGATLSWKIMEYLPFRRMDLQNGTWKPIRWPLPCGETRDTPDNIRVHGSVIRRMKLDENYRPGNLIVGGGGRGCRVAPKEYGMGEWVCVAGEGDPVNEIWVRKKTAEELREKESCR